MWRAEGPWDRPLPPTPANPPGQFNFENNYLFIQQLFSKPLLYTSTGVSHASTICTVLLLMSYFIWYSWRLFREKYNFPVLQMKRLGAKRWSVLLKLSRQSNSELVLNKVLIAVDCWPFLLHHSLQHPWQPMSYACEGSVQYWASQNNPKDQLKTVKIHWSKGHGKCQATMVKSLNYKQKIFHSKSIFYYFASNGVAQMRCFSRNCTDFDYL